jgi:septal ring factor EnvC (AmiA/AmiB activator)
MKSPLAFALAGFFALPIAGCEWATQRADCAMTDAEKKQHVETVKNTITSLRARAKNLTQEADALEESLKTFDQNPAEAAAETPR